MCHVRAARRLKVLDLGFEIIKCITTLNDRLMAPTPCKPMLRLRQSYADCHRPVAVLGSRICPELP